MGTSTVTLKCAACGSDQFERPANPKPQDKITCKGCGATGTYGQVIQAGKKQIVNKVRADLTKALKGIKGFKIS
ncbi:MAG: hypothetical protein WC213_09035 [Arenimonas sp.]|jgi:hypothetical protein